MGFVFIECGPTFLKCISTFRLCFPFKHYYFPLFIEYLYFHILCFQCSAASLPVRFDLTWKISTSCYEVKVWTATNLLEILVLYEWNWLHSSPHIVVWTGWRQWCSFKQRATAWIYAAPPDIFPRSCLK